MVQKAVCVCDSLFIAHLGSVVIWCTVCWFRSFSLYEFILHTVYGYTVNVCAHRVDTACVLVQGASCTCM